MVSSQLGALCRFVSETSLNSIPDHVIDHAKLVLVDTMGVIIAGTRSGEVSRIADHFSKCSPAEEGVTCPGLTEAFDPLGGALINGMAGSSLEYEEGNFWARGHPAIQVVPAVVAASEAGGLPGADLLAGLISGYEVGSRVGRASSIRKGLHPTGTWGTVGSALGVGCVKRKSPEELSQIASIAASYALSPYVKNSFVGRNVASTFAGLVNYLGLLANLFFEVGIRADDGSFEMTFSHFVSESLDPDVLEKGLGHKYAITENYFKPYPTCRFTHPAIDALKGILQETPVSPRDVAGITVSTFRAAIDTSSKPPANVEAMRFSLPYLIAMIFIYGKIDLGTLSEDPIHNMAVTDLAKKVELIFSPEYEALLPRNNPAMVTIRLRDGRKLSREIMNCWGDSLNPMGEQAIYDKFRSLAEPVIGQEGAEEFLEKASRLEHESGVQPMLVLLRSRER